MAKKPSIVFFGTGPVAAKSLELLQKNFNVEAVITKPKPAHHRGDFPVLTVCQNNNLPIVEVIDKKSVSAAMKNHKFASKIGILIDFGIIVTKDVIDRFEKGIVNSHFSLLPQWRGADPITFSILSGQEKTGVSLMLVNEGMDTGKLLTYRSHVIKLNSTTDMLTDELITLSDKLLQKYIPKYLANEVEAKSQPHPDRATYSRKLTKDDSVIDWTKPAEVLEREVRAFKGWPQSRTSLAGVELAVVESHVVDRPGDPGSYEFDKTQLIVFCGKNALSLDKIKPAGKSAMPISAFLAGYSSRL